MLKQRLQTILQAFLPTRRQKLVSAVVVLILIGLMLGVSTGDWPRSQKTRLYKIESFSFYQMDWPNLMTQIGLTEAARIERMRLNFRADGQVVKFSLTAYDRDEADDPYRLHRVSINYDPAKQQLAVKKTMFETEDAAKIQLNGMSTLSRLAWMLDDPDWAAQLETMTDPWIGLAYDGNSSLGTPPDQTYILSADGGFRHPQAAEMPLDIGTTIFLFNTAQENGPSNLVYYYLLPHNQTLRE